MPLSNFTYLTVLVDFFFFYRFFKKSFTACISFGKTSHIIMITFATRVAYLYKYFRTHICNYNAILGRIRVICVALYALLRNDFPLANLTNKKQRLNVKISPQSFNYITKNQLLRIINLGYYYSLFIVSFHSRKKAHDFVIIGRS